MNEQHFEGTLVLEKLARIDKLEKFMEEKNRDTLHFVPVRFKKFNVSQFFSDQRVNGNENERSVHGY